MRELILTPLMAVAGIYDYRERKIPNHLICSGWASALLIRLWQEGAFGVARCIAAILITIAVGFALFKIRAVGAGDVKLLSVIGGMHGLNDLLLVSVVWLVFAAFISLAVLIRRRIFLERFRYFWFYFTAGREKKEPYYDKSRDSAECTIILAPIMVFAYILVLLGRWRGIC